MTEDGAKTVSTKLKFPLRTDGDLEKLLLSLGKLFSVCFQEKGTGDVSFDINEFPPKELPPDPLPFARAFYGNAGLERFQRSYLKPKGKHHGSSCYLLGELKLVDVTENEIKRVLEYITIINPGYKVLSCTCDPQDYKDYHGRIPSIFLSAVRKHRAELYLQILEFMFKAPEEKKTDYAERVLALTARAFADIVNGKMHDIPNLGQLLKKEDLEFPEELPHLKRST